MVLALIDDVSDNPIPISTATRKSAILLAPSTELREIDLLFRPLAAALLNVAHKIAQRHSRGQLNEHVNMVADAIDAIKTATTALDNSPNVTVQMLARLIGNGHLTAIGVDDNMIHRTDSAHKKSE